MDQGEFTTYAVTLQAETGSGFNLPPLRRLRAALKVLLRSYGLRATRVQPVPDLEEPPASPGPVTCTDSPQKREIVKRKGNGHRQTTAAGGDASADLRREQERDSIGAESVREADSLNVLGSSESGSESVR